MDGVDRAEWRKSSYSGGNGGNCVEVAVLSDGSSAVRDSKDPGGARLAFAAGAWRAFVASVKDGEFDLA
jgi:hypothetical protein